MNNTDRICFLGTGAGDCVELRQAAGRTDTDPRKSGEKDIRHAAGLFLPPDILVDRFSPERLQACGIPAARIRHLLVSHGHEDHFQPRSMLELATGLEHGLTVHGNATICNALDFAATHQWNGEAGTFSAREGSTVRVTAAAAGGVSATVGVSAVRQSGTPEAPQTVIAAATADVSTGRQGGAPDARQGETWSGHGDKDAEQTAPAGAVGSGIPQPGLTLTELRPGDTFRMGEVTGTAVLANHMIDKKNMIQQEQALNFLLERGDKVLFYALDSSYVLPETLEILVDHPIDIAILDATFGHRVIDPLVSGHHNFAMLDQTIAQLRRAGALKEDATVIADHISYDAVEPHAEIVDELATKGILLAYDGLTLEW